VCTKDESINAIIASEPEIIAPWISLFLVYGDLFLQLYDEYVCDHDESVRLTDSLPNLNEILSLEATQEITYNVQDIKAI